MELPKKITTKRTRKRKRKRRNVHYYSMPYLQKVWTCLQPTVALMPRDQLPVYNQHGQCISGSYMQVSTAPRAPTPSTASYISTPGPVLHDISHVYCEELSDHYCSNPLAVNYNQQINSENVRELPAHCLKHWGLLVDTGAYGSVAPRHFASERLLEPVLHPIQLSFRIFPLVTFTFSFLMRCP